MVEKESARIDPLLEPLLSPAGGVEAERFLGRLITNHAEPVVESIIRYKLRLPPGRTTGQGDSDDLRQEAVVQLVAELNKFRAQPDDHPISDVRGLAAVIAHRVCCRWMRRQFPERHTLKNRLYYLLTRQKGLALWRNQEKKLIAGFAAWKQLKRAATEGQIKQLSGDEQLVSRIRLLKTERRQAEFSGVLAAIFNHLGSPVQFDKLVGFLAALLPIDEQPMESTAENDDAIGSVAAAGRDTAWQVEKRIFLQRLWEEVRRLPSNQRAALLLNLRGPEGGGCIALFPATGIASLRELAETLGMSADEFAGLWNDLPIDDARIAELLHLTRQQVINARKSARERLTRQLKGFV
jgi:DNA-directed RNA polymerase specialized sigma24 family protein